MTGTLAAELVAAESAGQVAVLSELGPVAEVTAEAVRLADAPLAPLAAAALARAAKEATETWGPALQAFAAHLGEQRSVLALADAVDVLLETPASAATVAATLYTALLTDNDRLAREQPALAAVRLEGALRIALAGGAPPFLVLHYLAAVDPDLPEDYLEQLPRLIGIALDKWDADGGLASSLTTALETLTSVDAAASGSTHELACGRMRAALRHQDPEAAAHGLIAASKLFAQAVGLDETRDDAHVYAAVCSATAAFAAGDADRLHEATDALDDVMRRRTAWHRNMHQPAWRRPLLDAEVEWLGLVVDLRTAADRLAEKSWLDSAAAVGQLSRAYIAERATDPAAGLTAVVRPVIENAVASRAILQDQLARVIDDDLRRDSPALSQSAGLLLHAIRERRTGNRSHDSEHDGADEEGDPAELDARITNLAPRLRLLGDPIARVVAANADDTQLAEANAVVAAATASGVLEHPVLKAMRAEIVGRLEGNPEFGGETRAAVIALLDHTLTFLLDRYDRGGPSLPGRANILRKLSKDEERPHEKELQWEYFAWLATSAQFAGRAQCEMPQVATGRVDVIVRIGELKLVTEVKREQSDATRAGLQRYVPQAAAYSGSNVPFSQLLVLDLTEHASGMPHLGDLAWVVEQRATPDASPQHVISAVVVGNRPTPSELRTAR